MLLLEKGRVPAKIAVDALLDYLAESDRDMHTDLLALSDRSGVPYDTLETMAIKPDRSSSMEFDVADNILCATRLWTRWRSHYEEYYYGTNLNLRQCAHPDCLVWFEIPATDAGGRKEYCSTACANSHKRGNRRVKHFRGKAQRGEHSKKCRNGHERTPETTIHLKSGKIRCRLCNNARSNEGYHRKRASATA
jgi:hypothetical protein